MVEITDDYLTDFSFAVESPRAQAVLSNVVETRDHFCYTVGGQKLHITDSQQRMTLCGFHVWQLVLVEDPVPVDQVCDWCRGAVQ